MKHAAALALAVSVAMAATMAAACSDDAGNADDAAPTDAAGDAATDAPPAIDAPPGTLLANGTLGPWTAGPPMPVPRGNHASVILHGDLVVLGGNYRPVPGGPFVRVDRVDASTIAADGSLGAWRQIGTLPSPVSEPTAVVWNDTLLVIDGLHDDLAQDGQVWAAVRQADGTLGAFTSLGSLPAAREALASDAYVVGDTLYVMSGAAPLDGNTLSVLTTTLGAHPLVWHELLFAPPPSWRELTMHVFTGQAFHVLGGDRGTTTPVVDEVSWAKLAGGALTPQPDEAPLPAPTEAGRAVAVDGYAFLVGGKAQLTGGMAEPGVYVTTIAADGALGTWTASTPLPAGRTNHALALGPTHLYQTGGSAGMGGLDTVFYAQVRFPVP